MEDFRERWIEGVLNSEIAEEVAGRQGAKVDNGPDLLAVCWAAIIVLAGVTAGFRIVEYYDLAAIAAVIATALVVCTPFLWISHVETVENRPE